MTYLNHKSELTVLVISIFGLGVLIGALLTAGVFYHDDSQQRIEELEQASTKRVVTAVISAPHPGVDSPDFPMKVIDGKIHVKHADTGEWVTGPLDGNESVYVDAYHADNPNRRKRFVFVDGEWAETIYDVEAERE